MNIELTGTLVVSKSNWGKLQVPQAIVDGVFKAMNEPGIRKPEDKAHISVFTSEEIEKLGGPQEILERGRDFKYKLGKVTHVKPAGWPEMSRVWFIECSSPELSRLRQSYGLTPKMHGSHPFHITVACKPAGVRKSAARRDDEDDERKRRKSWFSRNKGLIMSALAIGGGAALAKLIHSKANPVEAQQKPGVSDAPAETGEGMAPAQPVEAPVSEPVLDPAEAQRIADMTMVGSAKNMADAAIHAFKGGGKDPSETLQRLMPYMSRGEQISTVNRLNEAAAVRSIEAQGVAEAGKTGLERAGESAAWTAPFAAGTHAIANLWKRTPKNILSPKALATTGAAWIPGFAAYSGMTGGPMAEAKEMAGKTLAEAGYPSLAMSAPELGDLTAMLTAGGKPISEIGAGATGLLKRQPGAGTSMGSGLLNLYLLRQAMGAAGSAGKMYGGRQKYKGEVTDLLNRMGQMSLPRQMWESIKNPKVWPAMAAAPMDMADTRKKLMATEQELALKGIDAPSRAKKAPAPMVPRPYGVF